MKGVSQLLFRELNNVLSRTSHISMFAEKSSTSFSTTEPIFVIVTF